MSYKLGSLFDGSGGFPLAGSLCGITPVWASEVEPYPIAVTRSRFPDMKHLGDISKINGAEIEPVDIITFGSPCQDLSVAGKRAGLKHEANGDDETTRSGLFMEAVRIIKEMREATNGIYPRFALWENVPGAFSSNKGEDFRIVLEELIKIVEPQATMPPVPKAGWPYADSYCGDGWSLAYRVFDAQYWGVPQRRRRIHLVADFRAECAGEVLFEREGVRGYFTQGRTPWESTSAHVEGSIGADDCEGIGLDIYNLAVTGDKATTLTTATGQGASNTGPSVAVGFVRQLSGVEAQEELSPTILAAAGESGNNKPCVAYTLKIRSGCDVDANGKSAGKGALIQTEKSGTLSTVQDQYLFQPIPNLLLDDQGGQQIGVRTDDKCPTLRAEAHGNMPCVVESAGFCTEHSAQARGIGYQEECAPTLRAGVVPAVCYSIENHPADSRVDIDESGKVQTLTSRMGTGGGNVPMVMEAIAFAANQRDEVRDLGDKAGALQAQPGMKQQTFIAEPVYCLQGNGIDRADTAGCNGKGWKEDTCYTLNTIDRPAVVYAVDQGGGKSGANVSEDTAPTLCTTHGGEPAVAYAETPICIADHPTPKIDENGVAYTLSARDYKAPLCAAYLASGKEAVGTLMANAGTKLWLGNQEAFSGDYHIIEEHGTPAVRYIVRRLTPTECARLQGFADRWGDIDYKEDFTDEEYAFWQEVRDTHAAMNGKATKEYTKEQMVKWYNGLHTDSAEYKLWGNGIALPPALYVMQGIADALNRGDVE